MAPGGRAHHPHPPAQHSSSPAKQLRLAQFPDNDRQQHRVASAKSEHTAEQTNENKSAAALVNGISQPAPELMPKVELYPGTPGEGRKNDEFPPRTSAGSLAGVVRFCKLIFEAWDRSGWGAPGGLQSSI